MKWICIDGKIINDHETVLNYNNRSFRYGDGLFETMKMITGRIVLNHFHFERLFKGLEILHYKIPSSFSISALEKTIKELADKNQCSDLCRIRLTVFRGNGNLSPIPSVLNYIIECTSLISSVNSFNKKGLSIGLYTKAQKSCDIFSNIKSANFLPSVMGAIYAEENKLDDCLISNTKGNIADATIANVFLIKENKIYTPSLTEGCINGVMRRCLLEKLNEKNYSCFETEIKEADVIDADEIFLTNAINGIRWVKQFGNRQYGFSFTQKIYNEIVQPLFK